jgi:hypothetical protein
VMLDAQAELSRKTIEDMGRLIVSTLSGHTTTMRPVGCAGLDRRPRARPNLSSVLRRDTVVANRNCAPA